VSRTNDGQELWRKLTEVAMYRIVTGGGSSTTSGALTAGQQTITLASTTSFSSADPVIFSGSAGVWLDSLSATPGTATIVTLWKVPIAVDSGASAWEAVKTVLGHPTEEGVSVNPTFTQTAIRSAIQDLPLQYIGGQGEIGVGLPMLGFNAENWATLWGIPESNITGANTAADPTQLYVGGSLFGTQTTQVLRLTGSRFNGSTCVLDFNDAKPEANGSLSLNRTSPTALPINFKCSSLTVRIYT
jgi:hypothetical protein